ncbi:MAG: SMC-Scp complex subunit ScpB [Oscillospiraceae bacterium]|nr:SMC-Scp complex subunit ScpB [Oscillospiraceae bacterium]
MIASKLQAAAEAVLFASGEPLELEKIAQALEIEPEITEQVLYNLAAELDERNSGICLLRLDGKYQLSSRPEYSETIRSVLELRKNTPLSQAAFEVLAVIAYNQPVTKSFVEQVRGVDCSGVISTLCQKKLIEEKGRLDLPGRPLVYGTTSDFLRCFSISSLDELPKLPETDRNTNNEALIDGENLHIDEQSQ